MITSRLSSLALTSLLVSSGMLGTRDNGLAAPSQSATTNTAEPEPVIVESRQVRRARERREAKNRRR